MRFNVSRALRDFIINEFACFITYWLTMFSWRLTMDFIITGGSFMREKRCCLECFEHVLFYFVRNKAKEEKKTGRKIEKFIVVKLIKE